jgi:hypothetical protein
MNRQLHNEPTLKDTPFLYLSGNPTAEKKVMTGGFLSGFSFLASAVTLDDLVRFVEEMVSPAPPVQVRSKAKR